MCCFHRTPFIILHVEQKLSSRPQIPCPEGFGAVRALDLLAVMGLQGRKGGEHCARFSHNETGAGGRPAAGPPAEDIIDRNVAILTACSRFPKPPVVRVHGSIAAPDPSPTPQKKPVPEGVGRLAGAASFLPRDEPLGGRFQKLSLEQYDSNAGEQPAFSTCGWGKTTSAEQAPSLAPFLSSDNAKEAVITTYPPDLGVIDGRLFSPTSSGSESISPTPAFPVSPETPYVTRSPRYPPFSPSGPQMGSPSGLYKGAPGPLCGASQALPELEKGLGAERARRALCATRGDRPGLERQALGQTWAAWASMSVCDRVALHIQCGSGFCAASVSKELWCADVRLEEVGL
ncbi:tensin-3-like [Pontoporia blainvillei]|uniref:Tensin-3-like n=1 Tax=Pontoporia blainvillei TaxID=48723 RepID=A0ABX0S0H1_PONBL|nr:tensin-3-like [Pontoporia blainvillei]